jgi:hypothetical protein
MEKHFVTFEQALALKNLGFGEPCFKYIYTGDTGNNVDRNEEVEPSKAKNYNADLLCISAPLKSQVFEWARDEYGLYHIVHHFEHNKNTANEFLSEVTGKLLMGNDDISGFSYHSTYKEAELACIDNLIEIVKSKKQ